MYAITGDNAVNAASGWTIAEFNVFGNAGGGQANFNSGSTVVTRTRLFDNVNQIAARDGTALRNPFHFEELYHRYADSWRVTTKESLFPACGDREIEHGIPAKPFTARNLDPKERNARKQSPGQWV